MNLQADRIVRLCAALQLRSPRPTAPSHSPLASESVGFSDFLERLPKAELDAHHERARQTRRLCTDVPKAQIQEFDTLALIERAENVVLIGPSGVGKTHFGIGARPSCGRGPIKARFISSGPGALATR